MGDGLLYIDREFKHEMEAFEAIKERTESAILENEPNTRLVADWKHRIRKTLLEVRDSLVE